MKGREKATTQITRREFLKLAGLASLLISPFPDINSRRPQSKLNLLEAPNFIFILFDTWSARNTSLFGYPRNTTPNIARFADRATVFHQHYAGGNFTTPGTASLLTGVYPWSHRGLHLSGSVSQEYVDHNLFSYFADVYHQIAYTQNPLVQLLLYQMRASLDKLFPMKETALVEEFYSEDYFPSDFPVALRSEALLRGTDILLLPTSLMLSILDRQSLRRALYQKENQYRPLFPRGLPYNERGIFFVLEDTVRWIHQRLTALPQPFLAYFHLWPPHLPYNTRAEFVDLYRGDGYLPPQKPDHQFSTDRPLEYLREQRRCYDEYIAYVDAEFGRLADLLEAEGLLQNTYVILTSDHGELFERGIHGHSNRTLYQPLVNIPLLISKPAQRVRTDVHAPTSCVDLLPTLLHLSGRDVPGYLDGEVLPTFRREPPNENRSIYVVEGKENWKYGPLQKATVALLKGRYKLVRYFGYEGIQEEYELFDLEEDPEELRNLVLRRPEIAGRLIEELSDKLVAIPYQSG